MRKIATAGMLTALILAAGCSSSDKAAVKTEVQQAVTAVSNAAGNAVTAVSNAADSAATAVSNAAGDAATAAAEAAARNIATQQGEEQFKNAGQELNGPLTCTAKSTGSVDKIDINCTGTTKAGGAAVLSGTTSKAPGASVTALDGTFTGTVDGKQVFTTDKLGG